ncbi:hypothetical protein KV572_02160 [Pseudomonas yamanorum]|uniref:PaaX family transcriptional regulator C-terminal domain-containing protein n=1 Tax=Pseudomonas yamanorum TaxID=515393 RepID=UPI001C452039|nr:PaaX family transcriptional regulator C-terminal domain-containing protein [Pseudomonas yamanorum]MBV6659718.1 hypothetical protein [Pseudomonas yamanorum]
MKYFNHEGASSAQGLLLSLFGIFVLDQGERDGIPTGLAIAVLEPLGISESATRMALNRMVQREMLTRRREGRTTTFLLTETGASLLTRGRDRVFAVAPFDHQEAGWTLLSVKSLSLPVAARYQFETRLLWAGFGMLDTRVWIAPGCVDVADLLEGILSPDTLAELHVFYGYPAAPARLDNLICSVWAMAEIQAAHQAFLVEWANVDGNNVPALSTIIRLLLHWTQLLRKDPGLPGSEIDNAWPASRSTETFKRLFDTLKEPARQQFFELSRHCRKSSTD